MNHKGFSGVNIKAQIIGFSLLVALKLSSWAKPTYLCNNAECNLYILLLFIDPWAFEFGLLSSINSSDLSHLISYGVPHSFIYSVQNVQLLPKMTNDKFAQFKCIINYMSVCSWPSLVVIIMWPTHPPRNHHLQRTIFFVFAVLNGILGFGILFCSRQRLSEDIQISRSRHRSV